MAKYIFKCKDCAQKVEIKMAMKKYKGSAERDCEFCGGELVRVIGAAPVSFRGSGWYCKDD